MTPSRGVCETPEPYLTKQEPGGRETPDEPVASSVPASPSPPPMDPDEPRCDRHATVPHPPPCIACKRVREARPTAPPSRTGPGMTPEEVREMAAEREKKRVSPERAHAYYQRITSALSASRGAAS